MSTRTAGAYDATLILAFLFVLVTAGGFLGFAVPSAVERAAEAPQLEEAHPKALARISDDGAGIGGEPLGLPYVTTGGSVTRLLTKDGSPVIAHAHIKGHVTYCYPDLDPTASSPHEFTGACYRPSAERTELEPMPGLAAAHGRIVAAPELTPFGEPVLYDGYGDDDGKWLRANVRDAYTGGVCEAFTRLDAQPKTVRLVCE